MNTQNSNSKIPEEFQTLYDVYEPLDKYEGRGGTKFLGRFTDKEVATARGKSKGLLDYDVEPKEVLCIIINGMAYPVNVNDAQPVYDTLKDAVLQELSQEQRDILGLNGPTLNERLLTGWHCPTSPSLVCEYDVDDPACDSCIWCQEPEERK